MDQKRLFLAIAISLAIMIGFQTLLAPNLPQPPAKQTTTEAAKPATAGGADATPGASVGGSATAPVTAAAAVPKEVPRVPIEARLLPTDCLTVTVPKQAGPDRTGTLVIEW